MAQFKVEWSGLNELQKVLEKAQKENEPALKAVMYNKGEEAKTMAREYAPKPGGSKYGANPYAEGPLHENIKHKPLGLNAEIHATMAYSGFVNFGTRYMDAQPFMTDMVEDMAPKLEKGIREVAEGLFE